MSQPNSEPDPSERLKRVLNRVSWDHDSLARYVRELEHHRTEEDIFRRLAFRDAGDNADSFVTNLVSELYDPLNAESKSEVQRWWHAKVQWEAARFDDLKERLLKLQLEHR
jgi:hypothetical protein